MWRKIQVLQILDIIDPTTTVSADSSQGNEALFGVNAGKQCVAMSLTAIIYHQIQDISMWTNLTQPRSQGLSSSRRETLV